MAKAYHRRTTCRLCNLTNLALVMSLPATPPGDHYLPADRVGEQAVFPLDLSLCTDCGLLHLPDVVDPEILYGNYLYTTSISLGLTEHFRCYTEAVLRRLTPPGGALVADIGSNDGTLLRCFQGKGLRVIGIDPAGDVARRATESGIETMHAFFTPEVARTIRKERGSAAIITANNVMANIDDMGSLIEGVRELMADDGVFIFETGYMPDLVAKTILDNIYHEHISYFSVTPLESFFRRNGLALFDVERIPTKGGSFRGFVQHAESTRQISPSVTAMLADESHRGFAGPEALASFADRLHSLRDRLLTMVLELKSRGKTIAGYGASVGVTTMLYHFGLGEMLDFLVDDNPIRHGLFSPGFHLPVFPSQALYDRQPDYTILFAWQYAEPILNRHQSYLERNGHFIIPLPDIRML